MSYPFDPFARPPRYRDLRPDPWDAARAWFGPSVCEFAPGPDGGLHAGIRSVDAAVEVMEILQGRSTPLITAVLMPGGRAAPRRAQTIAGSLELVSEDRAHALQAVAVIGRACHVVHVKRREGRLRLEVGFVLNGFLQPHHRPPTVFRHAVNLALELAFRGGADCLHLTPDLGDPGGDTLVWRREEPRRVA